MSCLGREIKLKLTTSGAVGQGGMFGINRVSADVVNKWKRPPAKQGDYNKFVENIR